MQVARGEHKALGGGAGGGEGGQREGEGGNNHHTQAVVCGVWGCGVEEGNGRGGGVFQVNSFFPPQSVVFLCLRGFVEKAVVSHKLMSNTSSGVSQADV